MLRLFIILITTTITLLHLVSCGGAVVDYKDDDALTVIFAGDVLLDRGVKPIIRRHGVEYLFRDVSPFFHDADFTVVNLECPVTNIDAPLMKKYIFRADDTSAAALRKSGVTHCAMANNHIMDQGQSGLADTYQNLLAANLVPIGYGLDDTARLAPAILQKDDIKVAIFNDCALTVENYVNPAHGPGIANVPIAKLLPFISDFHRQYPDTWIVALLHWGIEFRQEPNPSQRIQAAQLFAAGADVIVGHHPHVVQDIDTIQGKTVYYSIGNFVFDQQNPLGRQALMPIITFRKDTILHRVIEVEIERNCPRER